MATCCAARSRRKAAPPDFRFEIRSILSKNCFACHGPDEGHRQADLRLDDAGVAVDFGAIVPGSPDESELMRRVTSEDIEERMPPAETGRKLTAEEIEKIQQWIAAGAEYSRHWSYEPPQRPALPKVSRCRMVSQRDRLFCAGASGRGRSEARAGGRPLSLDPPAVARSHRFAADGRGGRRVCARRVAGCVRAAGRSSACSPAYGEHWARKWLDLARYADTTGYEKDTTRNDLAVIAIG